MRDILGLRKSSRTCLQPGKLADFFSWTPKKRYERQSVSTDEVQRSDGEHQPVDIDEVQRSPSDGEQQPVDTDEVQHSPSDGEQQPVDTDEVQSSRSDGEQQSVDSEVVSYSNRFVADLNCNVTVDNDGSIVVDPKELMPGEAMIISIDEHGTVSTSVVADNFEEVQSSDAIVVEVEQDGQVPGSNDAIRGRKRVRDEKKWKRNVNKRLRQQGREYTSRTGSTVKGKKPCLNSCLCNDRCKRKCSTKLDSDQRDAIFESYYELQNEDAKNAHIFGCISPVKPRSQRLDAKRHRQMSFRYSLTMNGSKAYVCKKAFAVLHQISMSKIDAVTKQHALGLPAPKPSCRGKHHNRPNALCGSKLNRVMEHISTFPTESSHYSRSRNTNRMYLSSTLSVSECVVS